MTTLPGTTSLGGSGYRASSTAQSDSDVAVVIAGCSCHVLLVDSLTEEVLHDQKSALVGLVHP